MNVQERIIYMVSWATRIPSSKIVLSTSFKDDLQLDDIDFISLILRLEKWFNVTMTREQVEGIETIKDLVDLISPKLNKFAA